MPESGDQTAQLRRANWVGLRTLRHRPRVVDHTKSGEPVFEVRSVRLILRADAGHFTRLGKCSRCGGEAAGAQVLSVADLDQPAHSVICKDCVRAAVVSTSWQPERRGGEPDAPPSPELEEEGDEGSAADEGYEARVAVVEEQLQAAMTRLSQLEDAQRSELASLEQRLQDNMAAITHLVELERRALEERLDVLLERLVAAEARAEGPAPAVSAQTWTPGIGAGGLLEALDRQLLEAEGRLEAISGQGRSRGGPAR